MKKLFWICFPILLTLTWSVNTYHLGVLFPPSIGTSNKAPDGIWMSKKDIGINQIILFGPAYQRGREFGRLTQKLIYEEEQNLIKIFNDFFPTSLTRHLVVLTLIRWFKGTENLIPQKLLEEIYGVSEFTTNEFNYLASPFVRQIAYHGIHDVGQFFMDHQRDDLGCTVIASKKHNNWIIGRNFDFEAGRIFDDEKIMKWVFPDLGNPYLSVTWAGMVGTVTGVNNKGLYISLNAAGSTDFRRLGAPTTLLITEVLQFANNTEEAIEMIKKSKVFITDIFVLVDQKSGRAFRIEKTPLRFDIKEEKNNFVVTNHLLSDLFKTDTLNNKRKKELTTLSRYKRAKLLVDSMPRDNHSNDTTLILSYLRDKNDISGHPLLGANILENYNVKSIPSSIISITLVR